MLIDPGHGGHQPGTSHHGLVEKDLNLDVVLRIMDLFERSNSGIKAYATRLTDVSMANVDRAEMGNQLADLFVSVHFNAMDIVRNPAAVAISGTEIYYFPREGVPNRPVANIFQRNLVRRLGTTDRGVKTNNFAVLTNSVIPAILIEVGFLTNPEEAARIATPEFRQAAAEEIYNSIVEVFATYRLRR